MKKSKITMISVALCMALGGCGKTAEVETKYPVLKMMSMGSEPGQMEEIYKRLDELTESQLGIDVRISFYPWEDEAETVQKLVNSNSFDIYVCGSAFGSEELIRKGAFLDMKPYLETVPELVEFYGVQGIDLSVQETVYSVPRLMANTGFGFLYREDLRKEWGLEPVTDFDTMESYLYRAKEEYPENAPINDKRFFDSLLDLMIGKQYHYLDYGMAINWDSGELVSILDTPEYRQTLETAQKWYRDGIVPEDVLYLQNNNTMLTLELMKEDKAAAEFCNHFSAVCNNYIMALYEANAEWELGWLDYALLNGGCYNTYFAGEGQIGLAIDSNCRYPELAVAFLEKAHTDSRYYNLLSYGVEGIHYTLSEDGSVMYDDIPAENVFRGQIGLEQEAMMLYPLYPENWDLVYRDVQERFTAMRAEKGHNNAAVFNIVTAEYPEYAEVMAAYYASRIRQMLETGTYKDVDEGIEEFRNDLDGLGYRDFLDEVKEAWEKF